jgi:hypothetical protein
MMASQRQSLATVVSPVRMASGCGTSTPTLSTHDSSLTLDDDAVQLIVWQRMCLRLAPGRRSTGGVLARAN